MIFCCEALQEAIAYYGKPLVFNTDQGSQFTCGDFIKILKENNIVISMDGKGRASDNIVIERFWRSLKQEKIYRIELETVKEAKTAVAEYIDFYNNKRKHQSLGYQTPRTIHFESVKTENANNFLQQFQLVLVTGLPLNNEVSLS